MALGGSTLMLLLFNVIFFHSFHRKELHVHRLTLMFAQMLAQMYDSILFSFKVFFFICFFFVYIFFFFLSFYYCCCFMSLHRDIVLLSVSVSLLFIRWIHILQVLKLPAHIKQSQTYSQVSMLLFCLQFITIAKYYEH